MYRSIPALALALAGCAPASVAQLDTQGDALVSEATREHLTGDVYHHAYVLQVGEGPNARLRVHRVVRERAPWRPRPSFAAVLLMHGDFATFATNFAPALGSPPSSAQGMAVYLAERGVDVWGLDRRWTQAPAEGADLSDFDQMGLLQELDDIKRALGFARAIRLVTDASAERMTLAGFSRGGQLAYLYAAQEAARPAWQRHVKGLVPIDVYAALGPEHEEQRALFCEFAAFEYQDLAAGVVDTPNLFQIRVGTRALEAPDDPTPIPFFAGLTNREVLLAFAGQTAFFFPASPWYHLAAPVLDGDAVTGLAESSEDTVARWFAGSPVHQSLRESADTDAMLCGEAPLPADLAVSAIRVPLFYLGAAGGYGDLGLYTTAQVGSTDVTTHVVRRLPAGQEASDFGHGDLLFAGDAPSLAWDPLLTWLRQHR